MKKAIVIGYGISSLGVISSLGLKGFRSNWLSTYYGVNFPWIAYMDLVEKKTDRDQRLSENVYWIDLNADIFNLVFGHGQETMSFRECVGPYLSKDKTFSVLSRHDISPFLREIITLPMRQYRFLRSNYTQ